LILRQGDLIHYHTGEYRIMDDRVSLDGNPCEKWSESGRGWPLVSVIVPFFGTDTELLDRCIGALQTQDYPRDMLEVIIVDNNVRPTLVDRYRPSTVFLSVIHEPQPGSYSARNMGISIARGAVYAFTDSDCTPARDWVRSGVMHLRSTPNCGFVAGRIVLTVRNADHPGLFELYDLCINFRQEEYVRRFHFGATANLIAYADVFEKVGRFDPRFMSGGDCEWGLRVWKTGYRQVFAPDVVVYHPARSTLRTVCDKARRTTSRAFVQENNRLVNWGHILLGELRGVAGHARIAWKRRREFGYLRILQVIAVIGHVQVSRCFEAMRLVCGGAPRR
jgi:GT2 family glycosyltransferase